MKSPWKLLSQLLPKRAARNVEPVPNEDGLHDLRETPPGQVRDISTPEPAPPANGPTDNVESGDDPPSKDSMVGDETFASPVDAVVEKVSAPVSLAERTRRRTATPRRRSAAKAKPAKEAIKSTQTDREQRGSIEDVMGLDDNIKELRLELARMLLLQNAQLKEMLERFDAF